ncbi:hypothetical protein [Caballeronia grimmiae]|uniref:hypothetical protein n=1 Tax=Caballeronia grimmiae TaxID=1071679 RepID=UPI0038B7EEB2
MGKPWETADCGAISSYLPYYTVAQAAILWCGVPVDQMDDELARARPLSESSEWGKHVLQHPYIPCFEKRCRALQHAIDNDQLQVGRDGGAEGFSKDLGHVAYSRRTLSRETLKKWIAKEFPSDKPAFLFDELERSTHHAINADTFRALQADRDMLKARLDKSVEVFREQKEQLNVVTGERDSLRAMVDKLSVARKADAIPGDRAETTYQHIIGALLCVIAGEMPKVKPHPSFDSDAKLIDAIDEHFRGFGGLSKSNLSRKFPEAKRSLRGE